MPKRHKFTGEAGGELTYTIELGRSLVANRTLRTLVEGKVSSLIIVRSLGMEMVPEPWEDEAMVFIAFFDTGLWIPSVRLVAGVLRLYGVELAQMIPNSIVWLGVFKWTLRARGA